MPANYTKLTQDLGAAWRETHPNASEQERVQAANALTLLINPDHKTLFFSILETEMRAEKDSRSQESAEYKLNSLKAVCKKGATLLIRECGRPGYDRSYKVYTVQTDKNWHVIALVLLNPMLLGLGWFERDPLDTEHIRVQHGEGGNAAQTIAESVAFQLFGDTKALDYEEI